MGGRANPLMDQKVVEALSFSLSISLFPFCVSLSLSIYLSLSLSLFLSISLSLFLSLSLSVCLSVSVCLLRWHVRRDGARWEELRWGEKSSHDLRWDEVWSVKCEVWSAGCEERSVKSEEKVRLALHCNVVAQVIFLENNTATASHKARTHGPGWRTAHASSMDEKGLIV